MYKMLRLSLSMLVCVLSASMLQAQNYTVNVFQETAFAEGEHTALGTRPTPITVPHLTPASVTAAMANPSYLPSGSSPFTFVIAHRGSHTAPGCAENSACAIAAAYEAGADAIELDIKITEDKGPVLGHDVAIARELNNWNNPPGVSVTRSSAWTPFSGFPIVDYTYLNLTTYPFLTSFLSSRVDVNNPTRSTMNVSDLQNGVAVDTYNQTTGNHQLTLYEALYLIQTYYPMAIWLDVKTPDDIVAVGPVIAVARQQMGATGLLANISLKLSWKTLSNDEVNGNPGVKMGQPNISYFLVFGTGDLDTMAKYGRPQPQPTPTNPVQASSQAFSGFKQLCTQANGCLGAELSHKYPNAPTQAIFGSIQSANTFQLAGFQSVPQYSWYWQTLATQKQQATTYGRTLPRTDGSCCFALTDSLNVSEYIGDETQDLRALFSWSEANFSTITTDEPLTVLRDLTNQGKRPVGTATHLGANTTVPSGGSPGDTGIFADGLYYIQEHGYNLAVAGPYLTLVPQGQPTTQQMWYLSGKPSRYYTLTSAATGQSIYFTMNGSVANLSLGQANNTTGYLWSITAPYSNPYIIQSVAISDGNWWLGYSGTSVRAYTNANLPWTFTPVNTPSSESAQQQRGPAGYTYCSDGDLSTAQTCSFTGQGSVAYGANGSFRYLQYTGGPVVCQLSSFNNIDPIRGVHKACFYAPYDKTWTLPSNFSAVAQDGGTFSNSQSTVFAYGVVDPNRGALYTYQTITVVGSKIPCGVATFGYDPAPGFIKTCSQGPNQSTIPTAPAGFSYCAGEGGNCVFSGTAAVAYGSNTKYSYKTFTNGVHCGVDSFGLDPFPNVLKSCFYMAATPLGTVTGPALPSSFSSCAGTCENIPQGSLVAYGATYQGSPSYVFKTLSGAFSCSIATFGIDPSPGVTPACHWAPQSWVNRGPAGFTFCALAESGRCQFNGVAEVAYGADGNFVTKSEPTNGIDCKLSSFGKDPYVGFNKACYYRLY